MHFHSQGLAPSFAAVSANDTRAANDNFFDIITFGTLDANGNPPALKLRRTGRTKLAWPDGYYAGYCYDPLDRMSVAMANSTSSGCATNVLATYTYDPYSRRTNLAYGASASMAYSYTPAGDLTNLTDTQNGTANSVAFTLGYTNAHQLASEAFSNSAFVQNGSVMGTTAYAPVNVLNQYTNVTPVSGSAITPSYDGNGNLTGDGTYTFAYDPENRLVTAAKSGLAAVYAYDPLGRREEKSGTGVTATVFLQDGSDEIAEYNTSGTLQRRFVPGPAIDDPIAMVPASGTTELFYTDHHGSVIATSDASGNLVEGPFSYDAYGDCYLGSSQATPCSTVATGEPFKFTGQYFDAETGCYYYRARIYCADPIRGGRFLQTDPVGYKDDLNLYAYVGNDPTDKTDPSGNDTIAGNGGVFSDCGSSDACHSYGGTPWIAGTPDKNGQGSGGNHGSGSGQGSATTPNTTSQTQPASSSTDAGLIQVAAGPQSSPNFLPPTNPPQAPPTDLPPGYTIRPGPPTADYPNGYWRMYNPEGHAVDPSTMKQPPNVTRPEFRARTHVEYPPKSRGTIVPEAPLILFFWNHSIECAVLGCSTAGSPATASLEREFTSKLQRLMPLLWSVKSILFPNLAGIVNFGHVVKLHECGTFVRPLRCHRG